MKRIPRLYLFVAALGLAAGVYAASVDCPIDKLAMYATGKTTTEMGKMLYEHKCANGHTTWVVK